MKFSFSARHHFNSEAFLEGRGLILEGMAAIKANIHENNFQAARETLGRILHTLQVRGLNKTAGHREVKGVPRTAALLLFIFFVKLGGCKYSFPSDFKVQKFKICLTILSASVLKSPKYIKISASFKTCSPVWVQQRKGGDLSVSLSPRCLVYHCPLSTLLSAHSLLSFSSFCASLILTIWPRWLVPPIELCQ